MNYETNKLQTACRKTRRLQSRVILTDNHRILLWYLIAEHPGELPVNLPPSLIRMLPSGYSVEINCTVRRSARDKKKQKTRALPLMLMRSRCVAFICTQLAHLVWGHWRRKWICSRRQPLSSCWIILLYVQKKLVSSSSKRFSPSHCRWAARTERKKRDDRIPLWSRMHTLLCLRARVCACVYKCIWSVVGITP